MNSHGKSTDCKSNPDHDWSEDLARLHCLKALFPDWTGQDAFLLNQLKASIEASIEASGTLTNSLETFTAMASSLRNASEGPAPFSHGFIRLDFSNRTWDPLFARHEIIQAMKKQAGMQHLFLVIVGLDQAIFPNARYRTKARATAKQQVVDVINELAGRWSTPSTSLHLLYI